MIAAHLGVEVVGVGSRSRSWLGSGSRLGLRWRSRSGSWPWLGLRPGSRLGSRTGTGFGSHTWSRSTDPVTKAIRVLDFLPEYEQQLLLERIGNDPEFYAAVQALIAADILTTFVKNYPEDWKARADVG